MLIDHRFPATALALCLSSGAALATPLDPVVEPLPQQSPIDIITGDAVRADLPDLIFNYADKATLKITDTRPDFLNPENATVRADICPVCGLVHGPGGVDVPSNLTIGGVRYDLLQFHLHAPGEHEIDGVPGSMELHLVHQEAVSGALAVVGIIINSSPISPKNEALAPYFDALSDIAGGVVEVLDFDLSALIPDNLSSYRYTGSLTAPSPATEGTTDQFREGVEWNILATQIEVSAEQYEAFVALFEEGNARHVQPLNGRTVFYDVAPVPLPATGVLFLFALGGLAALRRRA